MAQRISQRIAVIGAGSMGGAVAAGLVRSGAAEAGQVMVSNPHEAKMEPLRELGIACYTDSAVMLAQGDPDLVVLAVKPQVLPGVVEDLSGRLDGRAVVSIAAGIPLATLEGLLPSSRVLRAMPCLPVQVLSGASAVCAGASAAQEDVDLVLAVFGALGSAKLMREDQLDTESVVVGCEPAFVGLFVDYLTRAGVEHGLPAADCREMVLTTMRGACDQLLASGEHPRAYMEKVTSPGGTTAAALKAMETQMFFAVGEAVDAGLDRTRELAG